MAPVTPSPSATTGTVTPTPTATTPRWSPRPTASRSPTKPTPIPTTSSTATVLPSGLSGHVIWRIPTTRRVVALTFDGGSAAQAVAPVVSTLRAAGVPATFFLTGRFVQTYPQLARSVAGMGAVGNHTMTHPHPTQLSATTLRAEVLGAETVIRAAIGRAATPWFRFPYGEYDPRTLGIVNALGYAGIGWTVDTLGWRGRSGAGTVDDIVDRVVAKLQPGAIVLMHLGAAEDGSTLDADALPKLIAAIRHAGYSFVTVSTLL
jgi:peptidoglycan/xylan/chitin deacetylase (PgdA/CDA1 family)